MNKSIFPLNVVFECPSRILEISIFSLAAGGMFRHLRRQQPRQLPTSGKAIHKSMPTEFTAPNTFLINFLAQNSGILRILSSRKEQSTNSQHQSFSSATPPSLAQESYLGQALLDQLIRQRA